jgi:ABC-type uncharacterized transport system fused permease/ATPase subunit
MLGSLSARGWSPQEQAETWLTKSDLLNHTVFFSVQPYSSYPTILNSYENSEIPNPPRSDREWRELELGQPQLVCLGSVILRRTKILILDEATASVDTATDNLIQYTLRQQFSWVTVITIAHQITSVLHRWCRIVSWQWSVIAPIDTNLELRLC